MHWTRLSSVTKVSAQTASHQRVLGHDLARSRREHGEHLGGLAAKVDCFTFNSLKFFAFRQEDKTAERDRFGRFRVNFRSLSGHFTLLARLIRVAQSVTAPKRSFKTPTLNRKGTAL